MISALIRGSKFCDFCNQVCEYLSACSTVACRDFCVVVGEDADHIRIMSERDVLILGLAERAFAAKGDWLACPICSDLILDARWDLIEERAIRLLGYVDSAEENGVRRLLRAQYDIIKSGGAICRETTCQ